MLPARNPFVGDSILGMDAIAWLIIVVIVLVVAAVAFVIIRRRRRGGGVIATRGKK
jgi:ABC-type enterochelin transport system permease subunit